MFVISCRARLKFGVGTSCGGGGKTTFAGAAGTGEGLARTCCGDMFLADDLVALALVVTRTARPLVKTFVLEMLKANNQKKDKGEEAEEVAC